MFYIWQHIQTIIEKYTGEIPLTHFLKHYYKQNPKLGSRDRRILSEMGYCWYRTSQAFDAKLPFEEKMQACLFICETSVPQIINFLPEKWKDKKSFEFKKRIAFLGEEKISFEMDQLLSFSPNFSQGIQQQKWLKSFLLQPLLFIRVRKNHKKTVALLNENNVAFQWLNENCLAIPNGSKIDQFLPPESYVVQDASSQKTSDYFQPKPNEKWWDCCSGAGGKSLLLKDLEPTIKLTVSDKRSSILHNLKERFKLYGLEVPKQIVIDVSLKESLYKNLSEEVFDNIICDVPCTGSGTWARTPEQLYFFEEKLIKEFSEKQKQIAENVIPNLKKGGKLIYITCSIFKEENEMIIEHLINNYELSLEEKMLINGLEIKADSMFIAVLKK